MFQEYTWNRTMTMWQDNWGAKPTHGYVPHPTPDLPRPKDWDPPEWWVYAVSTSPCMALAPCYANMRVCACVCMPLAGQLESQVHTSLCAPPHARPAAAQGLGPPRVVGLRGEHPPSLSHGSPCLLCSYGIGRTTGASSPHMAMCLTPRQICHRPRTGTPEWSRVVYRVSTSPAWTSWGCCAGILYYFGASHGFIHVLLKLPEASEPCQDQLAPIRQACPAASSRQACKLCCETAGKHLMPGSTHSPCHLFTDHHMLHAGHPGGSGLDSTGARRSAASSRRCQETITGHHWPMTIDKRVQGLGRPDYPDRHEQAANV